MKRPHEAPSRETKPKRQDHKFNQKRGLKYLQEKGITVDENCQSCDPFFKVKGVERYLKTRTGTR